MNIWQSLTGNVRLQLTSADISRALRNIENHGIPVQNVILEDMLTISMTVRRQDVSRLQLLCDQRGDSVKIRKRYGIYWVLIGMKKRPVILIGMLLLLALSIWLSGHILFVQVEGNIAVPTNLILENASQCGIRLGVSGREVRSEKMKNALLQQMPQLQWAGINTQGCIAVITVRERAPEETPSTKFFPSSIVAQRDGVVEQVTVLQGSALCAVGQTVKAGDLLISGYTDCELCVRVTQAVGEVYARTFRNFTAVCPSEWSVRKETHPSIKKYSLIIGKKRINLYNSSGILDTGCVKIYSEQYVVLPGGYILPVAVSTEEWISADFEQVLYSQPESVLQPFISEYLKSQMIGGQILSASQVISHLDGVTQIDGIYSCYEMIGISVPEERLLEYENR